ncbi:MAG: asparagine synthase-related protein [Phycisphaerae bacterium]|jgi:asparagine synthetase B (glutamine-hydrolysing)
MCDFLFSRKLRGQGHLSKLISGIYSESPPEVFEFHGQWGSLAVSRNLYTGFDPYETGRHIMVVLGGPVLRFCDNSFLVGTDKIAGTKAVYERWIAEGKIKWDSDLSGPFAILLIDKDSGEVTVVTDLLAFVHIFSYIRDDELILSSHIDIGAKAAGKQTDLDMVSVTNFIIDSVVTYPYAFYRNFRQVEPGAVLKWQKGSDKQMTEVYWRPREENIYSSIDEAADAIRAGLKEYIDTVTRSMEKIGLFLSGGEDSRLVLAMLPGHKPRDAFIFLDGENKEGKIAKKAADFYGAKLNMFARTPTYYLDILQQCSELIGAGSQYEHVHAYQFYKSLNDYSAVFGGYLSDTLLKGDEIEISCILEKFPFLPEIRGENKYCKAVHCPLFKDEILEEILERKIAHYNFVKQFRPESADEWVKIWPIKMCFANAQYNGHSRLFRCYEPFTANDVVKVSASVPQSWKLNRRLFRAAAKPALEKSKWLRHSDGRLPYFPWYINMPFGFAGWFYDITRRKLHLDKIYQGPWYDSEKLMASQRAKELESQYDAQLKYLARQITKNADGGPLKYVTNHTQRRNWLQAAYNIHSLEKSGTNTAADV